MSGETCIRLKWLGSIRKRKAILFLACLPPLEFRVGWDEAKLAPKFLTPPFDRPILNKRLTSILPSCSRRTVAKEEA